VLSEDLAELDMPRYLGICSNILLPTSKRAYRPRDDRSLPGITVLARPILQFAVGRGK
jgi:hypothetical protein